MDWQKLRALELEIEALMANDELTLERELALLEAAELAAGGDPELVEAIAEWRRIVASRPPPTGQGSA